MSELKTKRWKTLRLKILQRDNYDCVVPGCETVASTVDHIVPRSRGGDMWNEDNLVAMCGFHNSSKNNKLESETRREWFSDWFDDIDMTDCARV